MVGRGRDQKEHMKTFRAREVRLTIAASDTTCIVDVDGLACPNVRTSRFGTKFHCAAFGNKTIRDGDDGFLVRLSDCIASEVKS